jgi:LPXTG-motif cell wall-anchored protein
VRVSESGTAPAGTPISFQGDRTLDASGVWQDDFYIDDFYLRGTTTNFTVECYDGPVVAGLVTGAVTGTVLASRLIVDSGAAATAPASIAVDAPLTVTGDCGTSASIVSLTYYVYDNAYTQIGALTTVAYTGPADYSLAIGTPTSLGLPVGETARVQVFCTSSAPATHTASVRETASAVVAAAVVPPAPAAPTLAATGAESILPLAGGLALITLGGVVLLLRRRREGVIRGQ